MDLLSQHEAFLRAIFDAPDDDTPRLVYADFLEENGEPERADVIRWQCDPCGRSPPAPSDAVWGEHVRGFRAPWRSTAVRIDRLADPDGYRAYLVSHCPECFAVESVRLHGGRIRSGQVFDVLLSLAPFARVTELVLEGEEQSSPPEGLADFAKAVFAESVIHPVIDTAGVEALARHRGMVRVTSLDLRNNNLDNDAARALVRSPYLDNLKQLQLLDGNRLRGKVWQQVIGRFGEDVAG
jgi:uncharacterized protein (TIGR02996 family)